MEDRKTVSPSSILYPLSSILHHRSSLCLCGEIATKMSKAALLQFKPANTSFVRHSNVRSVDMVREVVRAAEKEPALVIHTFASRRLRQEMEQACQEFNVASLDLIGPLIEKLAEFIGTQPAETPGLLHQVDDDYFDRIDALA